MRFLVESVDSLVAYILGNSEHKEISGYVKFTDLGNEIEIDVHVNNLPVNKFLGFHIHSKGDCSGNKQDEFKNVRKHLNPSRSSHPEHAGDLPLLYSSNGKVLTSFRTNRFKLRDILGKAVIIHSNRDDFSSQPSGNSGEKIACGKIIKES